MSIAPNILSFSIEAGSYFPQIDNFNYSLAQSNPPAVPEPATWGMMVAGLGMVGAAMRRRAGRIAFA